MSGSGLTPSLPQRRLSAYVQHRRMRLAPRDHAIALSPPAARAPAGSALVGCASLRPLPRSATTHTCAKWKCRYRPSELNEERPSAGACGAVSPSRVPNVYETRRNRTTLRETRPRDEHKARREGRAAAAHARAAAALSRQGGVGSAHEPGITASEGCPRDGGKASAVHRGTSGERAQHSYVERRSTPELHAAGRAAMRRVLKLEVGKRDRGEAGLGATQPLVRARKNRALLSQPLPSVGAGGHRRGKGRVGSF